MTTSTPHVITATHPPYGALVHNKASGTVTNIACNGPALFNLYNGASATGTPIFQANFPKGFNCPVNVAYTQGLYIEIYTPHTVTISVT